jgi:SAM-dependent methyltransferase
LDAVRAYDGPRAIIETIRQTGSGASRERPLGLAPPGMLRPGCPGRGEDGNGVPDPTRRRTVAVFRWFRTRVVIAHRRRIGASGSCPRHIPRLRDAGRRPGRPGVTATVLARVSFGGAGTVSSMPDNLPPHAYGDAIADVYDELTDAGAYGPGTQAAVDFLARLAGAAGTALELGIGTGRVALPLAARGVAVTGIDASARMVAQLRAKPGGADLPVTVGDMAEVVVPGPFDLVYVVASTLYCLPDQNRQLTCLSNAAGRLRPGGHLVVEAFVPDPTRFERGQRVEARAVTADGVRLDVARHDPLTQTVFSQQVAITADGIRLADQGVDAAVGQRQRTRQVGPHHRAARPGMALGGGKGGGGQVEADQAGDGPAAAQRREAGTRPAPQVEDHPSGRAVRCAARTSCTGCGGGWVPVVLTSCSPARRAGTRTRALRCRRCTPRRTSRRRGAPG